MWVGAHECRFLQSLEKSTVSLGTRVTSGYEPPNMNAENSSKFLCKSKH